MLAALGCIWSVLPGDATIGGINSRWDSPTFADRDAEALKSIELPASEQNLDFGGSRAATAIQPVSRQPMNLTAAAVSSASLTAWLGQSISTDHLGDEVGALGAVGGEFDGGGNGTGDGGGQGGGFFGIGSAGTKFVYVVDCSNSMNHPHQSAAGTRFKRLKLELLNSIGTMDDDKEFFIIFFNHEAIPMHARSLQAATVSAKQKHLYWMQSVSAGGDTDPREALWLAMRLEPDIIYFLTDGDFRFSIKKDLLGLKQNRVAIHTFAFGNPIAEEMLRDVAKQNRGEYHFIP
jgi:hypothetical protein